MLHELNSVNQFSQKSLDKVYYLQLIIIFIYLYLLYLGNLDHMNHRIKNEKVIFDKKKFSKNILFIILRWIWTVLIISHPTYCGIFMKCQFLVFLMNFKLWFIAYEPSINFQFQILKQY